MKETKAFAMLIFITLVLSLFLGCTDTSKPNLIGTWEWDEDNEVRLTFFDDGRLIQYLPPNPTGPREIHSNYVIDNTHLTISHEAAPGKITIVEADFEYIDSETIVISYDNGAVSTYYKTSD